MSPILQSVPANQRAASSLLATTANTSRGPASAAHAILTSPDIILSAPAAILPALCQMLSISSESLVGDVVGPPCPSSRPCAS